MPVLMTEVSSESSQILQVQSFSIRRHDVTHHIIDFGVLNEAQL